MACCRPWLLTPPKYYSSYSSWRYYPYGIQVPCGCCLNCRVDNRNQWSDRAKYEYKKRLTASFVTLTYNDYELLEKSHKSPVDDTLVCSIDYSDVRKFFHRLREYIKEHEELHGVLCQPDFTYLYVGEYGENGQVFDRPHFHVLFFGLDFAFCKKIFEKEWKFGFIDVLPLLDGGINYVLKYMDKEVKYELAVEKYDRHLLARPRRYASIGFGRDLYYDNVEDIKKNNMTYKSGHVRRPVPAYYKKQILGDNSPYNNPILYYSRVALRASVTDDMKNEYHLKPAQSLRFTNKQVDAFKLRLARNRERKLRQKILNNGVGVFDYLNYDDVYFSPRRPKIRTLNIDIQRFLADEYRKSICCEVG